MFLLAIMFFAGAAGFSPPMTSKSPFPGQVRAHSPALGSSTSLSERRWNFNEGQSPWGLKKNAEIWNGRFAQMAFVAVFLQELVQGKGALQGIQEGDPVNIACAAATFVALVGLTGFLASKGDDDYVNTLKND